jgi:hypothetical protein
VNLKLSAVLGAGALVLSLFIGLVSGVGIFALWRALFFGAVFFGLASLAWLLIKRFLPEMLEGPPAGSGSWVDISVEDSPVTDLSGGVFGDPLNEVPEDGTVSLTGDTEESPPREKTENNSGEAGEGLDQSGEIGYIVQKPLAGNLSPADGLPAAEDFVPMSFGGVSSGVDIKPGARSGEKAAELVEEYQPQQLAQAVQTIIKREG